MRSRYCGVWHCGVSQSRAEVENWVKGLDDVANAWIYAWIYAPSGAAVTDSGGGGAAPTPAKLCCDKCDGSHRTDDCPYFKGERDDHPDASGVAVTDGGDGGAAPTPAKLGGDSGNTYVSAAEVVRQLGDGLCLFHSLAFGR